MPVPAKLEPVDDPIIKAYRQAWDRVTSEFNQVVADPLKQARTRRLQEILRTIARTVDELDVEIDDWIATGLPKAYAAGMASSPGAGELVWTQIHQQATQQIAQDLFDDLLKATTGVENSAKSLVREVAKDTALQTAIDGRTAVQAGKEMERILKEQGLYSVIYKDGSRHGLAEYSQVAIRTKTAEAFNTGTLNQHLDVQFFEVFDGPLCGWSAHDDPESALGLVVTREEAFAFPISHPNCRRSFGPRPDIGSKADVKRALDEGKGVKAGNVTPDQREAQRLADEANLRSQGRKTPKTQKTAKTTPTTAVEQAPAGGLPSGMSPSDLMMEKHLAGVGQNVQTEINDALAGTKAYTTGDFAGDPKFTADVLGPKDYGKLYASQESVDVGTIHELAQSGADLGALDAEMPVVIAHVDGADVIIDGHHRLLAAAERGESIKVWRYDPPFEKIDMFDKPHFEEFLKAPVAVQTAEVAKAAEVIQAEVTGDVLDTVIDASKFEKQGSVFGPGVKNRGYARAAHVPNVTQLIDAGWSPAEAVAEQERLFKNAKNVERRARKKLTDQGLGQTGPKVSSSLGVVESNVDGVGAELDSVKELDPFTADFGQNPKILYSGGQTIGGRDAVKWSDRLTTDTKPGEYVPVRGLKVNGITVENGVAIRRHGRAYLLEVEDAAHINAASAQLLEQKMEIAEKALDPIPNKLADLQKSVVFARQANPDDAMWAVKYNTPGFKSVATGGNGATVYWAGNDVRPGIFLHEFGHNVDSALGSPGAWISQGDQWAKAVEADGPISAHHAGHGFKGSIYGHEITPGTKSVTSYGANDVKEDFAESVRLYLADRHNGYLGYTSVPKTGVTTVRFADVFPERAAMLDQIFGFEPVFDTPFQLKQIELATEKFVESVITMEDVQAGLGAEFKLTEQVVKNFQKEFGLPRTALEHVFHDVGPKAVEEKLAKVAAEKAAAEAAAELAAKAAAQMEGLAKLDYSALEFSDKTSIGLKKSNAVKKALKEGKSEVEAKAIGQQVYERELDAKLDALAESRGLDRSLLKAQRQGARALARDEMRPEFSTGTNQKAGSFLTKAGKTKHPLAQAQGHVDYQAKANIAAELASRLDNPEDRKLFEAFKRGRPLQDPTQQLDEACSDLVQRWAGSSGDSNTRSLILQMAIKDEFGVTGDPFAACTSAAARADTEALYQAEGPFVRRFLREMYDHTQEELRREGVTEVSVYRGMRSGVPQSGIHRPALQPANSWSTRATTSRNFGHIKLSGTIPASRILGSARTGFGCLNEMEYVILDSDGLIKIGTF